MYQIRHGGIATDFLEMPFAGDKMIRRTHVEVETFHEAQL